MVWMARVFSAGLVASFIGVPAASQTKGEASHPDVVRDIDGHAYPVVTIDTQVWLGENLQVVRSPDGSPLETFPPNESPEQIPRYGRLYAWEAAKRACPSGWHLPSDAEWSALEGFLGESAGRLLRDPEFWPGRTPSREAERVGFRARPAGYANDQAFDTLFGTRAVFWTATTQDAHFVWSRVLSAGADSLRRAPQHPQYGFSVRCLADRTAPVQEAGAQAHKGAFYEATDVNVRPVRPTGS